MCWPPGVDLRLVTRRHFHRVVGDIILNQRVGCILPHQFTPPIVNHKSSMVNRQSSTVNRQSSIVNRQSSIVNRQSSIVNRQSSIVNRQSSIVNRQSSIVNRQSVLTTLRVTPGLCAQKTEFMCATHTEFEAFLDQGCHSEASHTILSHGY